MDSKEFKLIFGATAKRNGFEAAFSGWFLESNECMLVLDLQKSNYANYFELNIKIFIQGAFGNKYVKSKELVKKHIGNILTRPDVKFAELFDLDAQILKEIREELVEKFFTEYLMPFSQLALTKHGIWKLAEFGEVFLLPAVKEQLELLKTNS